MKTIARRALILIATIPPCVAFAQENRPGAREFFLRRETQVAKAVGLPAMTRAATPGAPTRELRLYVGISFHEPSLILRIVDSAGTVRIQRVIWWWGEYSGFGQPDANGNEGLGLREDSKRHAATRAAVLARFKCDSVRVLPVVEACRLTDYPAGSTRLLLDRLDSLGVARLPWNDDLSPDGSMLLAESWDGHDDHWYFYWSPDAKSPDAAVRAAAEIM
jgi:hypothetical protein